MAFRKATRLAWAASVPFLAAQALASECDSEDTIEVHPVQIVVEKPIDVSAYCPENTAFIVEDGITIDVSDAPTTIITKLTKTTTMSTMIERKPTCGADSLASMASPNPLGMLGDMHMGEHGCPAPGDNQPTVTVEGPGACPTPMTVTLQNMNPGEGEGGKTVAIMTPGPVPSKPWTGPCVTHTQEWDCPEPTTYTLPPDHHDQATGTAVCLVPSKAPGGSKNGGHCEECVVVTKIVPVCPNEVTVTIPPSGTNTATTHLVIPSNDAHFTTITKPYSGSEPITKTYFPNGPGGEGTVIVLQPTPQPGVVTVTEPLPPGAGNEPVTKTIQPSGTNTKTTVIIQTPTTGPGGGDGSVTITRPGPPGSDPTTKTIQPSGTNTKTTVIVQTPAPTSGPGTGTVTITEPLTSGTVTVTKTVLPSGTNTVTTIIVQTPGPGITTVVEPLPSGSEPKTTTLQPTGPVTQTTVIVERPTTEITTITEPLTSGTVPVTKTIFPTGSSGGLTIIVQTPGTGGIVTVTGVPTSGTEDVTTTIEPTGTEAVTTVVVIPTLTNSDGGITTIYTSTATGSEPETTTILPTGSNTDTTVIVSEPTVQSPTMIPTFVSVPPDQTSQTRDDGESTPIVNSDTTTINIVEDTTILPSPTTNSAGTTVAPSVEPTADQSCDNAGLEYAIIRHPFYNGDAPAYSSFDPTYFYDALPLFAGTTERLGIRPTGEPFYVPFSIYDDSPPLTFEYTAVNHQAYLYAPKSGSYQITIPSSDDITLVWVGANAISGWTRDNADIVQTYVYTGSTPVVANVDLVAGSYTPFRVLWGNGQTDYNFFIQVVDPDGELVIDGYMSGGEYFVQYSCDGTAPRLPPWGTVEKIQANAEVAL